MKLHSNNALLSLIGSSTLLVIAIAANAATPVKTTKMAPTATTKMAAKKTVTKSKTKKKAKTASKKSMAMTKTAPKMAPAKK